MHRRAALLLDRAHHKGGAKILDGNHGGRVGQARHHPQHQAEAMEKRHGDAKLVLLRKIHAVADGPAVVHDVVMGQHHALREARRTGGVLHVDHVLAGKRRLQPAVRGIVISVAQAEQGAELKGTGDFPQADMDDAFQTWKIGIRQPAGLACLQGRAQVVENSHVIRALEPVRHDQRFGIGLLQQIFQLIPLVVGVDRDKHGADFCRCKQGDQPFWHIGGPDGHVVPFPHADGKKALRGAVAFFPEFPPGPAVGPVVVRHGLPLRVFFSDTVQQTSDGVFQHLIHGRNSLP